MVESIDRSKVEKIFWLSWNAWPHHFRASVHSYPCAQHFIVDQKVHAEFTQALKELGPEEEALYDQLWDKVRALLKGRNHEAENWLNQQFPGLREKVMSLVATEAE